MANLYQFPAAAWAGLPGYKVCVAITAASAAAMLEQATRLLREHPFLELRLDSLPEPAAMPPLLAPLLQANPQAKLIATCRRTEAGGDFRGSVAEELAVLTAAARAGCALVDLALETAEAMRVDQHQSFRAALRESNTMLLISHHDYRSTRDLDHTLIRLSRHQPDVVKLVTTANSLADNLPILRLLGARQCAAAVAIAMGEQGLVSRVLGPRAGGLFTFGSAGAGAETAPGQLDAESLRELYRIDRISPATRVYGVAGSPVAHSLSPLLHNTGFRALGVDAVFLPLATDSVEDLLRLTEELAPSGISGLSITMPLKQAILSHLDYIDPLAARVGACNTVVREADGRLHGHNTDVSGVTAPLEARLGDLSGARVLVRGAGGAARAAVFGLRDKGAEVWIENRTAATAAALAAEAGARVVEPGLTGPEMSRNMHPEIQFDVLINATPAGMNGAAQANDEPGSAVTLPAKLIFDMVYRPRETQLIRQARAQGLAVITGEEMFLEQGARQFELWTGEPAPRSAMRQAVLDALTPKNE